MTQNMAEDEAADDAGRDREHQPELKRSLNGFQMFAISFAAVSVVIGIFATYDDVLQNAGPVGIWLFPVVAAGQLLVALVYAQFAARIPLSGSSYTWASRLASPRIGWAFGWVAVLAAITMPVAINNALASQCLMPLFNMEPNETTARVITVVLLVIQTVLAIAATRIVGWVNSLSVGVEIGILLVLGTAFAVVVLVTGEGTTDNLFSRGVAAGNPDYFAIGGGLMAATLMGLTTLVGFESAANMTEEAENPFRSVPRAIIGSVAAAGLLGFLFIIVLTVAIKDLPAASASESSVAEIMHQQFGNGLERPFLAAISFAFFGAALVTMTSTARYIFAMSRDGRFPGHQVMRRVNSRTKTPIPATLLVLAVGVILMIVMPGAALLQLIATGAILNISLYLMTIVLYLGVRRKFGKAGVGFDLGRFEWPVAISALVWLIAALAVVLTASTTWATMLLVVGLLIPGLAYFLYMLRFDRHVLDNRSTDSNLFTDPTN